MAKEKKSKKKEKSKKKSKDVEEDVSSSPSAANSTTPVPTVAVLTPEQQFEASQLFLRYDQHQSGFLSKESFQNLITDVNNQATTQPAYNPLRISPQQQYTTFTESIGSPLGFSRTSQNSQFEAGQLFERYDSSRVGTLGTTEFQKFYKDFSHQLSPFFRNSVYTAAPPSSRPVIFSSTNRPLSTEDTILRNKYNSRLGKLQAMLDPLILDKRRDLQYQLNLLKKEMWQCSSSSSSKFKLQEKLQSVEDDLQSIEWFIDEVRDHRLSNNNNATTNAFVVSNTEMQEFLNNFPTLYEFANRIIEKSITRLASSPTPHNDEDEVLYNRSSSFSSPIRSPKQAPPPPQSTTEQQPSVSVEKYEQAVKMLKVKDQIIWELLQERDGLRNQATVMLKDVQKLSEVSTEEMGEWAKLTDEMALELHQLRQASPPTSV